MTGAAPDGVGDDMLGGMRVLDLFCGAGGASAGYARLGFSVTGVDVAPQAHYPYRFVQADALAVLRGEVEGVDPSSFDLIHASPPCQRYSGMTKRWARQGEHPDLIEPTRAALVAVGV
jgi:DNA (cytosine-5)-methyltransferase 1